MKASADDTFSIDVVGESVKRFELGCQGFSKVEEPGQSLVRMGGEAPELTRDARNPM